MRTVAQPALTRTNRSIRNETLPIFYGANSFRTTLCYQPITKSVAALKWLVAIGREKRAMFRRFTTVTSRVRDAAFQCEGCFLEKRIDAMVLTGKGELRSGSVWVEVDISFEGVRGN